MEVRMSKKLVTFLASAGLLFITVIWGFAFVVVKSSLDLIPPVWMLAFRFSVAGIALSLIFIKKLIHMTKAELVHGLLIGVTLFLAYLFQTIGCNYTTAGKNAFLTTVYVILVPFINWGLVKTKPDGYTIVAAVFSLVGIGLLSLRGDLTMNIGDVLTLVCGLCYALQIIAIARYSQGDDPITLCIVQVLFTAACSWATAPLFDGAFPAAGVQNPEIIGGMLYLGLGSTALAFILQNVCQKYTPPSTAALLMSFESVFGALSGVLFLAEVMDGRSLLGCVLMFLAVVISETKLEFLRRKK